MMPLLRQPVVIGVDQQASARQKNALQADFVKHEAALTTRGGLKFTLIAVADGEGTNAPERAAQLAVQSVFQFCERSTEKSLPVVLQQAVQNANIAVTRNLPGCQAALTLVAILGNQLYCVHAGEQTRAYLVSGGQAKAIGRNLAAMIGAMGEIPVDRLPVVGEYLKQGDQVVVCTDGLFSLVPEKEFAIIGRYPAPLEAARHLSSLSMGRNVNDNVSVAVAQYGRKPGLRRSLLIAGAAALITFLVVLGVVGAINNKGQRPPDTGQAYVIDGQLTMTDPVTGTISTVIPLFTYIPGGSTIQANSNSHLRLSQENGGDVRGIDLYLGKGTNAILVTIDYGTTFVNGKPVDPAATYMNLTEIRLVTGSLLVLNEGTRQYIIQVGEGRASIPAGNPNSILGVSLTGSQATIACLQGSCLWTFDKDSQPLSKNTSIIVDLANPAQPQPGNLPDLPYWQEICLGCTLP